VRVQRVICGKCGFEGVINSSLSCQHCGKSVDGCPVIEHCSYTTDFKSRIYNTSNKELS